MVKWGRMLDFEGQNPHYDQGIQLFDQGQYEEAALQLETVVAGHKNDSLGQSLARFYLSETYRALALKQLGRGEYPLAIANLRSAIGWGSNYADLHYHLGFALLHEEGAAAAIPSFERALEIHPRYVRAALLLALSHYTLGETTTAFQWGKRALFWDAELDSNLWNQAEQADTEGKRDEVVHLLRRLAETESDDGAIHAQIAFDLLRRGHYADAIDEYRKALAVSPDYADLHNQLGVALFAAGHISDSEIEFNRAIEVNPRYAEAYINRGLTLRQLGRFDDAKRDFETACGFDPGNTAAQNLADLSRVSPQTPSLHGQTTV